MAAVRKKARRPIGSMLDTVVQETQNQINNDDRSDSDGSDNHSRTSETPISSTDESDHDETQNNGDDDIDGQDIVVGRGHAKMGSSNEGFMNSKNSSDATERAETEEELNNSDETDINIHSDGARVKETLKKTTRRSTRKTKVT